MNCKKKPKFFVMYKDFNGDMKNFDVIEVLLGCILNDKGGIKKRSFYIWSPTYKRINVRTREHLYEYIRSECLYRYWSKCEWEFIAIDWPYKTDVDSSHPVKIDVYHQLKPNLELITNLIWDYIEPKVTKLIQKENKKNGVSA